MNIPNSYRRRREMPRAACLDISQEQIMRNPQTVWGLQRRLLFLSLVVARKSAGALCGANLRRGFRAVEGGRGDDRRLHWSGISCVDERVGGRAWRAIVRERWPCGHRSRPRPSAFCFLYCLTWLSFLWESIESFRIDGGRRSAELELVVERSSSRQPCLL